MTKHHPSNPETLAEKRRAAARKYNSIRNETRLLFQDAQQDTYAQWLALDEPAGEPQGVPSPTEKPALNRYNTIRDRWTACIRSFEFLTVLSRPAFAAVLLCVSILSGISYWSYEPTLPIEVKGDHVPWLADTTQIVLLLAAVLSLMAAILVFRSLRRRQEERNGS